jgi:predicted protein tyrosine phosphatase
MTEFIVRVGGLHTIDRDVPEFRPTHMIGILDPAMPAPPAHDHAADERESLVLRFRDSEVGDSDGGPDPSHVESALAVIDRALVMSYRAPARLLIHCHAGASRSTATAYLTLVRQRGIGHIDEAFAELLRITNKPWPNRRIVAMADELLGVRGRMLAPLDRYRAVNPNRLEAYIRLHHIRAARDARYGEKLGVGNWRKWERPSQQRRQSDNPA